MQYSKLLSLLAALQGCSVLAVNPAASESFVNLDSALSGLESRDRSVGVYLCNDADFKGYCVHIVQPINSCIRLGDDLNDKVSSVGPDQNAGSCRFYNDYNCAGTEPYRDLSYPGAPNLKSVPNGNDAISSYKCSG
ncbi:hypothetical protein DL98DRAFT_573988 [Cadophora sp. DSE1049]|nr:hypothetical protein DL98DRAFT_573988 [Cadophora sp. DSE1049]